MNFIDNKTWAVYDGAHVENNCTDITKTQFSYAAAILTEGAAFMYNYVSLPGPHRSTYLVQSPDSF